MNKKDVTIQGLIIKGIGGYYYVKTDAGVYECRARGVFRKNSITPVVGDRVEITVVNKEKKIGNVHDILSRKNLLIRPLVSNVEKAAIVVSIINPTLDLLFLDKLLLIATLQKIQPIICINKIDIDIENRSLKIKEIYESAGFKVILLSSILDIGIDELKSELKDNITVFTGQSGVGKSTLINKVMDANLFQTGILSEKISRGKHTTRHTELVDLKDGGFILDSPGFSSIKLENIDHINLQNYYPEFEQFFDKCKFVGCSHVKEIKCAVKEAVENNEINKGRYERYLQIFESLKGIKKY